MWATAEGREKRPFRSTGCLTCAETSWLAGAVASGLLHSLLDAAGKSLARLLGLTLSRNAERNGRISKEAGARDEMD